MSESPTKLNFEILALDNSGNCRIRSEIELLYLFRSYGELWENPSLDEQNLTINDGDYTLEVQKVESDIEVEQTFLIRLTGDYDWLEPKRIKILGFLSSENFNYLSVFLDEVSEQISTELYPLIYKLENALRSYLNKFMITKVGLSWWKITATPELSRKVNDRKNNEKEFSQFIDNKLYLADFGDLGQLIYKHSSGFITKEDILKKINELEETPEAIRKLKNELQSNYQKFFREHFKNNRFQDKWQDMEKLRNKVAHNNLFTHSDLERGQMLFNELMNIIETARQEVDNVILQQEEKEEIAESIEEDFNTFYDSRINRNVLRDMETIKQQYDQLIPPKLLNPTISEVEKEIKRIQQQVSQFDKSIFSLGKLDSKTIKEQLDTMTGSMSAIQKMLGVYEQSSAMDSIKKQMEVIKNQSNKFGKGNFNI